MDTVLVGRTRAREKLKIASTLHGGLLKYPIFRDFSELNACTNSVYQAFFSFTPPLNAWVREYSSGARSMCKNHKTSCAQTMKPQYMDNIEKVTDLRKGMIHGGILQ